MFSSNLREKKRVRLSTIQEQFSLRIAVPDVSRFEEKVKAFVHLVVQKSSLDS